MDKKGFSNIALIVLIVVLIGGGAYFVLNRQTQKPSSPVIESISPIEVPIGAEISIIGSGFALTKNSLQFGSGFAYINDLVSSDGKTITFTLPGSFDTCNPDGSTCAEFLSQPIPGQTYEVTVVNANGKSNSVNFTVAREEGPPTPTPTPTPIPKPSPSPLPKPNGQQVSLREGQREGSLLVEKIYSDYVTGLNFSEYPLPMVQGYPVTLRIGESASNGCTVTLTLIKIEGDVATFAKKTDFNRPCPMCLAENTLIDTPSGAIPVQQLQKGMAVWTADAFGARVSATIVETAKTTAPPTHQVIHLVLNDGRELFVSPGHPTADGRIVGDLSVGETIHGGRVIVTELIPYQKAFTYDILPAGDTGFYWANGILIGSTLSGAK